MNHLHGARMSVSRPPTSRKGILEGITRDTVITLARDLMNIDTDTRAVDRAELYVADEMFLCGTAAQIAPVTRIDGRSVGTGEPGPVTLELQQLLRAGRTWPAARASPLGGAGLRLRPGYRLIRARGRARRRSIL